MSDLDRLLELEADRDYYDRITIDYPEPDEKEYQKLKLKCEQSLKLQEIVKAKCDSIKEFTDFPNQVSRAMMLELVDESENA